MKKPYLIAVLMVTVVAWSASSAQQEVRPTPGPGSGTMRVLGTVDIGTMPPVEVVQRHPWIVMHAGPWGDAAPAPALVKAPGQYRVVWSDGEQEDITVRQVAAGGWVRGTSGGAERWFNLTVARSFEVREAR